MEIGGLCVLNEFCRCCLSKKKLKSIFEKENSLRLSDMIMDLTSIEVSDNDALPLLICEKCTTTVVDFYNFKLFSEQNDAILRSRLQQDLKPLLADNFMIDLCQEESNQQEIEVFILESPASNVAEKDVRCKENSNKQQKIVKSPTYTCNLCNKEFATYRKLYKHNKFHQAKIIKCTLCPYVSSKSHLKTHMRTHTGERPFRCELCGFRFSSNYNLHRHIERHQNRNEVTKIHSNRTECRLCERVFATSSGYVSHMKMHTRSRLNFKRNNAKVEKHMLCNHCGKLLSTPTVLLSHIQNYCKVAREASVQKFKCDECNGNYVSVASLKHHKVLCHSKKVYSCSKCNRSYSMKSYLDMHQKSHLNLFKCSTCSKSFGHQKSLNRHKLIHLNIKPYACSVCGKTFRQSSTLKTHMLTHTGEKKFACTECPKNFALKATLKSHVRRIHTSSETDIC